MKNSLPLLLLAAVLLTPLPVTMAAGRSETVRVRGTDYVRLMDWSRVKGLKWIWIKRDETFQLTNTTARCQFFVDSREARVNGLQLLLLFPLITRNGEIWISQIDADWSIRPLIARAQNAPGKKIRTICLDAGHGGKEPGYLVSNKKEKDYTLRLAFELRDQLQKAGYKVYLTRSTDKVVELAERPEVARRNKADLFVSLHFNSDGGRGAAKGAEVYALTPVGAPSTSDHGGVGGGWFAGNRFNDKNLLLAHEIQKTLVRDLRVEDRGVRRARFVVLRDATMPAVLIEAGFMSHPTEGKKIFDAGYRRDMARAIAAGINDYKRTVER